MNNGEHLQMAMDSIMGSPTGRALMKVVENRMHRAGYRKIKVIDTTSQISFTVGFNFHGTSQNMNDVVNQIMNESIEKTKHDGTLVAAIEYAVGSNRNLLDFFKFISEHMQQRRMRDEAYLYL